MGPLGWQETVFIFVLALLIFGPKKLPELGKTIGKALTEFRRASSELKATWDREMSNLERESESIKEITSSYQQEITDYSYGSTYGYDEGYYGTTSDVSSADVPSTVSASATEGAEQTAAGAGVEDQAPVEVDHPVLAAAPDGAGEVYGETGFQPEASEPGKTAGSQALAG